MLASEQERGEGYLMESCFSCSYRPFHRPPVCPAKENNASTKPFVRTNMQHFHLRHPPIPKKINPRCIHTSPMLSQCCPTSITSAPPSPTPPPSPACPPFFWQYIHRRQIFLVFSTRSRCAQYSLIVRLGSRGGDRSCEREERRFGAG